MSKPAEPVTKEELAILTNFPQVHKTAIEAAIGQFVLGDDPDDKVWPDYFRSEMVECQRECNISDDDELEDGEYEVECVWFSVGWKAREHSEGERGSGK